jgi:hydroxymethylpyrimidine/phosphomethylpyrimidine kinase
MKKILLSVAGFDPSAGAGTLLDLKVFGRLGFRGVAVLTAVTVQNTVRVHEVIPLPAGLIADQFEVLAGDMTFAGLKIGMAGSRDNLAEIAKILRAGRGRPRVVDPVFRASSGAPLFDTAAVPEFLPAIRGQATVLTPNLEEAGQLTGRPIADVKGMREAAEDIYDLGRIPCLVKGGHLAGDPINLLFDGKTTALFGRPRIRKDVHGTGCLFSAALLGYLARGKALVKACELATDFTAQAIREAVRTGRGRMIFPG